MLRHLHIDLSQLTIQPDPRRGVIVTPGPRTRGSPMQRTALRGALEVAKPFSPTLGGALDVVDLSVTPPKVTVVPSRAVPIAARSTSEVTGGLGLTGTAAWVAGLNAAGGVYGSTTGEWGFFTTAGFVMGIVGGVGGGGEFTLIFGPPKDFGGDFVSFQASVGTAIFPGAAIGGSLLFAIGPPGSSGMMTLLFKGFAINVTGGWSALPVSVSVEWSDTLMFPMIK